MGLFFSVNIGGFLENRGVDRERSLCRVLMNTIANVNMLNASAY